MGRQWNPEEINDSPDLSPGVYAAKCLEVKEDEINEKLVYKANFEVVEPAEMHGQRQSVTFFVGTNDDPTGDDPQTWKNSIAAKDLKRMFKALRVPMLNDLEQMCNEAPGHVCVFSIVQTPKKDGNKQPIPGEFYVNVRNWKEHGTVEVTGSAPSAGKGATAGAAQTVGKTGATVAKAAPATVKCPICEKDVPKKDYTAHAASHDDGDE